MLQNWVGNGIGSGSYPLTLCKYKTVNLVIFWKQDGKSSSIFKDKMIENEKRIFPNLEKWGLTKRDKPNWINWKRRKEEL